MKDTTKPKNGKKLEITEKKKELEKAASMLKVDFVGLDEIIDKIIHNLEIWYIFPEIVRKPVIINLWGLTGVGKTDLIRKLVKYLNFTDKYLELVMDNFADEKTTEYSSIQECLLHSSIEENERGILLLDEIQKFRTISNKSEEDSTKTYCDLWELLSDGKFANAFDKKKMAREHLLEMLYSQERSKDGLCSGNSFDGYDDDEKSPEYAKYKYKTSYWNADRVKRFLRLTEDVESIMQWDKMKTLEMFDYAMKEMDINRGASYKNLLIFVCGNLDEAFDIADNVNDADTDADIFHNLTKKINVADIKKSLKHRFKPEQISRFGNVHIIYPSLSKSSYQQLIENRVSSMCEDFYKNIGIQFNFSKRFLEAIYKNSVYPVQGVRPVFSAIDGIFNIIPSYLVSTDDLDDFIALDYVDNKIVFKNLLESIVYEVSHKFDVDEIKNKYDKNFKTLVAVHETGHSIVYSALTGFTPQQIKSAASTYEGGYIIRHSESGSKQSLEDNIAISMAGRCAEEIVFGMNYTSSGGYSDMRKATEVASSMVRLYAMSKYNGCVSSEYDEEASSHLTDIKDSNNIIEAILSDGKKKAYQILKKYQKMLIECSEHLIGHNEISPRDFQLIASKYFENAPKISEKEVEYDDYFDKFEEYKKLNKNDGK